MLYESAIRVFRDRPLLFLFGFPVFLAKGKSKFKQWLAAHSRIHPKTLPYNLELLSWLQEERSSGRRLILCTASDISIANEIAQYLGIFDEVMASDGFINLAGEKKAAALEQKFGPFKFEYIGNSYPDLEVWKRAHYAVVVNAHQSLISRVSEVCEIRLTFPPKSYSFMTAIKLFRLHQWLKNLLLFVPLIAGHNLFNGGDWLLLISAFIAFGLCASSVYISNDLLDLESDRIHPRKRNRPFASGLIPIWIGFILAPILLFSGIGIAANIGMQFLLWLLVYFILTTAYSFGIKRLILIDCLVLALLYTLRIVAGAAVIMNNLSFWLLTFSLFLFLSLAFVKRYSELEIQILGGGNKVHGRGYYTSDATLIQTMGIVAGYISVLVLALYLNSDSVLKLYHAPSLIWGAVLVLLFWISWMWTQAHRGLMHDDPLVFAVKDLTSQVAGFIFALVLFFSAVGLPW